MQRGDFFVKRKLCGAAGGRFQAAAQFVHKQGVDGFQDVFFAGVVRTQFATGFFARAIGVVFF